jgi:hypothetical protein
MDAVTKASRAVLAEYTRKTLRPIEIVAIIIFVFTLIGTTYLIVNVSGWWWLAMIVVISYGFIGSILWLIIHFTIDHLRPKQTKAQQREVKNFVAKIDKISGTITTTKFGLLLKVIGDVMRKREQNVIQEFAHDSSDLKASFERVISEFQAK